MGSHSGTDVGLVWSLWGDLAEPKGFRSPRGGAQVLNQEVLTPEKVTGQYRKTELTERHIRIDTQGKDSQKRPHTAILLNRLGIQCVLH